MDILAISGSARAASTNTAMLRAVAQLAPPRHRIELFDGIGALPVFSPDLEEAPPAPVLDLAARIRRAEGLIIASPEYVRTIPGGLKNAIDWLVSRDEIIHKPVALMHASHRGEAMLAQLRLVLGTVTSGFAEDLFLRFELMKATPEEIALRLEAPEARARIETFLDAFAQRDVAPV